MTVPLEDTHFGELHVFAVMLLNVAVAAVSVIAKSKFVDVTVMIPVCFFRKENSVVLLSLSCAFDRNFVFMMAKLALLCEECSLI